MTVAPYPQGPFSGKRNFVAAGHQSENYRGALPVLEKCDCENRRLKARSMINIQISKNVGKRVSPPLNLH